MGTLVPIIDLNLSPNRTTTITAAAIAVTATSFDIGHSSKSHRCKRSRHYDIEVRVIRGFKYKGVVSSKVNVYDGFYKIVDCWFDVGKSGFGVYFEYLATTTFPPSVFDQGNNGRLTRESQSFQSINKHWFYC
ncbi:hypothetical protein ACFE04_012048 [Oxalis oulophora]